MKTRTILILYFAGLGVLFIGTALFTIHRSHAAAKCCEISELEQAQLNLELEKALRIQDQFNAQYQGGYLAAAARICKAHGWDCPAKVVFDPRAQAFKELPPPAPNFPAPRTPKPPVKSAGASKKP